MGDVKFHAGSKLSWLEGIARDRGATAFDLRVAMAISNRTNGDGIARTASQQWIARFIDATERGVRKSIEHLRVLGHVEPIRNSLGEGSDGRQAFGGNRHATEYRLLIKTRNRGSGLLTETRNETTWNGEAANPEQRSSEPGMPVPFLSKSSSKDTYARPRAHATDPAVAVWLSVRKRLGDEVGQDVFEAYFGKISLASVRDGVVTLRPTTKFMAAHLTNNYYSRVLRAWREHDPKIHEVRFDHLATWPSGASDERPRSSGTNGVGNS